MFLSFSLPWSIAIRMFDLMKRVEIGSLVHHSSTISSVKFAGNKNLITAGDDGSMSIWKVDNWMNLLDMDGHTFVIFLPFLLSSVYSLTEVGSKN